MRSSYVVATFLFVVLNAGLPTLAAPQLQDGGYASIVGLCCTKGIFCIGEYAHGAELNFQNTVSTTDSSTTFAATATPQPTPASRRPQIMIPRGSPQLLAPTPMATFLSGAKLMVDPVHQVGVDGVDVDKNYHDGGEPQKCHNFYDNAIAAFPDSDEHLEISATI
ncbi:hypothetical protein EW145_g5411 [Phellinidium pouzarii]|uniref:Uncharacterized protein n=1 Tax=Phellinidium pouzarii TaxID=167371 RepID=A0A4S4L1X0_9AGAM|nr:hypothetical protein EW145_g5411 [Phellinidium pouzarii]